jgi:hypothetical protein
VRELRESDLPLADVILCSAFDTFTGVASLFGDRDYVRTRWLADPGAAFAAERDGQLVARFTAGSTAESDAVAALCYPTSARSAQTRRSAGLSWKARTRGLWALVHALDVGDGEAAVAEVAASGLTTYWLIRGWVGHARAVTLGRQGRTAEAEEAFIRADADLAPCDWFRHHARRLVAEAAIADGWGNPTRWLAEALAFFDPSGPPAVASACRSLLRQAGAPVPRRRRPAPDLPAPMATLG